MITVILLAGGMGRRMGMSAPKQYLFLNEKPIALHSYQLFSSIPEVTQIVVVCAPEYRHLFLGADFAEPGLRRQDSVYSGLLKATQEIVLTHDAARPLVEAKYLPPLIEAIKRTGAAALAAPLTSTLKQCSGFFVEKTLDRSTLWEMQTPQGMSRSLFLQAFDYIKKNQIEVTDDLSMVEAMGLKAEVVPCTPRNLKITTPFDLAVAKVLCATK